MNPHVRHASNDIDIWYTVTKHNEYQVPEDLSGLTILDVGAHIGAFSWLAKQRNAKNVIAFEPHLSAYQCLIENVPEAYSYHAAVWRSDRDTELLELHIEERVDGIGINYGGSSIVGERPHQQQIIGIPLNDILHNIEIDIMKIDCEGSEYPILLTCTCLHHINIIIGEWHHIINPLEYAKVNGLNEYNFHHLRSHLENFGFKVTVQRDNKNLGLFMASRV